MIKLGKHPHAVTLDPVSQHLVSGDNRIIPDIERHWARIMNTRCLEHRQADAASCARLMVGDQIIIQVAPTQICTVGRAHNPVFNL